MADEKFTIAVAFPIAEGQRKLLRRLAPETPLRSLYRTDAQVRSCTACGMHLHVDPRVLAASVRIYCLICAQHLAEEHGATVASPAVDSLGSPESTPERHCLDCNRRYDDFPLDVALPDADWLAIHPEGPDGVLCAQCIVARAAKLTGVTAVVAHFHRVVRNEERDSWHERQKPDSMNDDAHPRIVALTRREGEAL